MNRRRTGRIGAEAAARPGRSSAISVAFLFVRLSRAGNLAGLFSFPLGAGEENGGTVVAGVEGGSGVRTGGSVKVILLKKSYPVAAGGFQASFLILS